MEPKTFLGELQERLLMPWSWPFFGYLAIVLVFGGIGVFFTAMEVHEANYKDSYKVAEGLGTFFISIIATSFIDLNLSPKLQNKKAIMMWSFLLYAFGFFLLWCTYKCKSELSFLPALVGTLFSVLAWVIANADNDKIINENFFDDMRGRDVGHGNNWTQ